jgi:hypothetical protein
VALPFYDKAPKFSSELFESSSYKNAEQRPHPDEESKIPAIPRTFQNRLSEARDTSFQLLASDEIWASQYFLLLGDVAIVLQRLDELALPSVGISNLRM